jgi:hypothetical protein
MDGKDFPGEFRSRRLVTVAHFIDLLGAQVAMTVLRSAGIQCSLRNEHVATLGLSGLGVDVQVDPEDAAAAQEILEQPPIHIVPDGDDA